MPIATFSHSDWTGIPAGPVVDRAAAALESGAVLLFPHLRFHVSPRELHAFSPTIVGSANHVSFDPATGRVGGSALAGDDLQLLAGMLARFSAQAAALVGSLLPTYRLLERSRASFRPLEIHNRERSRRKDDTRLHIDAFPSAPVHGRRILRLFTNSNPAGRPRVWRIGEEGFETLLGRFGDALQMPSPGSAALLRLIGVTRSTRSAYDALMLQFQDRMKGDERYQREAAQITFEFPAGSTWIGFTDEVPHAAVSGQYQLEQTFLLPVWGMLDESRSPLRRLERATGRPLT